MQTIITVGRTDESDIVIPSPFLSSTHARIEVVSLDDMSFRITDMESTNGTTVNGNPVGEAEFTIADDVRLGEYQLLPGDYLFYFLDREADEKKQLSRSGVSNLFSLFLGFGVGIAITVASGFTSLGNIEKNFAIGLVILLCIQFLVYLLVLSFKEWRAIKFNKDYYRQQHEGYIEQLSATLKQTLSDGQEEANRWEGYRKFVVEGIEPESTLVNSYYLRPHDGKEIPRYKPGQYLTFQTKLPGQEKPAIRCYSISDSYKPDYYRVSIKQEHVGAENSTEKSVSSFFHHEVKAGDIVDVKAPAGSFFCDTRSQQGIVMIAGGVGITPMISMLAALTDDNFRLPIWLFYGVRSNADIVQKEFLTSVAARYNNVNIVVAASRPSPNEIEGEHYDVAGRFSIDLIKQHLEVNNYNFFLCGSTDFMSSLHRGLEEWGVPLNKIHSESFGPSSLRTVPAGPGKQVTIEFARSEFTVEENSNKTLLEIAEDHDVAIDYGCRAGNCGTCTLAIRSGSVEYTENHDANIDDGSCLACIARPRTALVVDA